MTRTRARLPVDENKTLLRHPWVFYYDGNCGFCTRVSRGLARIDFFRRVEWVPFQALEEPPNGLTWEDLDSAAYLSTGRGRLHEGFYSFRMLTLRLLPLVPLAPLFWFPGMKLLGVPAYRWVAKNRYRISACHMPTLKFGRRRDDAVSGDHQSTDHPSEKP